MDKQQRNYEADLYKKYRPGTLAQMIGNEETVGGVIRVVARYVAGMSHSHSLMFYGPTGCGKTTLALNFARAMGCSLDLDLIKMDASILGGVDAVRELWVHSHYGPLCGQVRIWLLDECQAFTPQAQEALLGIIEQDDIHHCYFLFCTTESLTSPKLKPTLVGRCAPFQLKPLSLDESRELIERVCKGENRLDIFNEALVEKIFKQGYGRPRNMLNLLEREM